MKRIPTITFDWRAINYWRMVFGRARRHNGKSLKA